MYLPLHPKQIEFCDSRALYRCFIGGRGSGKSWVACYDLIRRALPKRTYLLASPTYPMLFDSELRTFAAIGEQLGVIRDLKRSAPASAKLYNGAEILFRSADDPERLRGPNLSGAVLMEAALMHRDAYDIAIACLREVGVQGWLTAASTPRGPSHWTYEVFATNRPDTQLIRASTGENPFNPKTFEATLQAQYGDTNFARQELGGEFVQLEGAEFPAEWFEHTDARPFWFDSWPQSGIRWAVQALDPSKGSDGLGKDYQAHVQIAATIEANRWIYWVDADLQREGAVPMCERAISFARLFAAHTGRPIDSLIVEDNATMGLLPQALDAACAKLQYPAPWLCRPSMDAKDSRIQSQIGPPLSRYQLRFRRTAGGRKLVGQIQGYPRDEFDDGPDALATGLKRMAELILGVK